MSVESFDPVQFNANTAVQVTDAAAEHFKKQIANDAQAKAVRLSVKESGCTGFMYVVDLVAEASPDDLHVELKDGCELLVAQDSLAIVNGTKIDYVSEGVNRQLQFLNPNAKDHCGCGESFNVN
ncbi:MAG: iron-sulfur cluster assembly accessory protein [Pseudohongiellaceae bacterium]|nr:iron-sulfur cluster assembly accessory protein [Pseudohongiellaceae bacterium]